MSRHSRWAAPQGPSAVSKAAERAARFNTGSSSSSSSQKAGSSSSGSGQTQSSSAAQSLDLLLSPSRGELAHDKRSAESIFCYTIQLKKKKSLMGRAQSERSVCPSRVSTASPEQGTALCSSSSFGRTEYTLKVHLLQLQAYYRRFSLEEAWHAGEANDILSNILLDYRVCPELSTASCFC